MVKQQNANKAAVQTTKLNKLPISNVADTEFASAEPASEAAKAFQNKVTDKNLQ
jgi:hypothetical protein